jgi:hypothetical protein
MNQNTIMYTAFYKHVGICSYCLFLGEPNEVYGCYKHEILMLQVNCTKAWHGFIGWLLIS